MPPTTNYPPLERLNWLIHLHHVQGEIGACKELIRREIDKSNGRNEYAFFKQVTDEIVVGHVGGLVNRVYLHTGYHSEGGGQGAGGARIVSGLHETESGEC